MTDESTLGRIEISDEVICTIAGVAANEVAGIAGMKGSLIDGIKQATTGKRDFSAGVDVERPGDAAAPYAVNLHVVMEYNVRIDDVAKQVQAVVKEKIEAITGTVVGAVNVHVVDIKLPEALSAVQRETA